MLKIRTKSRAGGGSRKKFVDPHGQSALEEPLSPTARLFHQPGFDYYVVAELGYKKKIDVSALKAGLPNTLFRNPRFCSILVKNGRKSKWVRKKVDLGEHVVVPDLDPDGNHPNPDQLVEDYIAGLTRPPAAEMDVSRPLWDFHVLNLRTSRAAAVGVLRAHHSLGDGISLMSALIAGTKKISDPSSPPSIPASHYGVQQRGRWPFLTLRRGWHTLMDILYVAATALFFSDTKTPLHAPPDEAHRPKRFFHRAISLDDVKAIKEAVGCSVNDVLLGLTSAALTRYLHGNLAGNDNMKKKKVMTKTMTTMKEKFLLLKPIRIRGTVVVNIRPMLGMLDLSKRRKEDKWNPSWGNKMAHIILPFPIGWRRNPLEYVRKVAVISNRKKNSLQPILTHHLVALFVKLLGSKVPSVVRRRVLHNTTFSFSNMTGPTEEIQFEGNPIVYIAPAAYGQPHALAFFFQSYMNQMEIVIAVDDASVPNPRQLLDDLVESLALIKDAAAKKNKSMLLKFFGKNSSPKHENP